MHSWKHGGNLIVDSMALGGNLIRLPMFAPSPSDDDGASATQAAIGPPPVRAWDMELPMRAMKTFGTKAPLLSCGSRCW